MYNQWVFSNKEYTYLNTNDYAEAIKTNSNERVVMDKKSKDSNVRFVINTVGDTCDIACFRSARKMIGLQCTTYCLSDHGL